MQKIESKYTLNGSISIYLALTLAITLSLLFCIIESARITSVKSRTKAITYLSMDSAFSHFALQLYENYGIFGVFTTEDNFLSLIADYADKNASYKSLLSYSSFSLTQSEVKDIRYNNVFHLTDRDGLIFAKQAIAFEQYRSVSEHILDLTKLDDNLKQNDGKKPGDIENGSIIVADDDIDEINGDKGNSNLYKDISFTDAATLKNNVVSKITGLIKSNLLLLFVDNPYEISHTSISDEAVLKLPSHTCSLSENAKAVRNGTIEDTITSVTDRVLFVSYLGNSFSSYFNEINTDISIKYQKEYILGGNAADNDNLLSAALSMVNLRAAYNLTYLLKDSEKRGAAFNLADSICLNIPIASQIAAFTILSAWSYAEGLIDVKDLFAGKNVPLIKTSDTWTLSLDGILKLDKNTLSANDGKNGYSYDNYLDMCLLLSDCYTNYFRCMDLIQLDICENCNPDFLMAACITGASVNITYASSPLFTGIIKSAMPDIYNFSIDMLYAYD